MQVPLKSAIGLNFFMSAIDNEKNACIFYTIVVAIKFINGSVFMKIKFGKQLCLGTLILFFLVAFQLDALARPLTIAVLPCSDVEGTFSRFQPLAKYLREETGLEISLLFPRNSKQLEHFIRKGLTDFAFQEPGVYTALLNLYNPDLSLQALEGDGKEVNTGIVVVRKDSGISSIDGLRGKVVEFGAEGSTPKWVAAKWLFKKNGIDINKDLKYYYHGGCCEDIAFTVFFKVADAGVICAHALEHFAKEKKIDPSQLTIIAKTDDVPTWVFSTTKKADSKVAASVSRALLKLSPSNAGHKEILNKAEIGGFTKTNSARIKAFRKKIMSQP